MKCFRHPAHEAAAICLACGKAVCRECLIESANGIACQPDCVKVLAEKNELHTRQAAHLKAIKRLNFLGSFFSVGMGMLFLYFSSQGFGLVYDFVFLLGAGFTGYGIVALIVNMFIIIRSRKSKNN